MHIVFIVIFSLLTWQGVALAESSTRPFKVRDGKRFAVCQELAEILNQPENAHRQKGGGITAVGEYVIPKRYKNFRVPKWEPVPKEELQQYVYKEDTKQGFKNLKDSYVASNIWHEGDFIFEKTLVNFDNFGPLQAKKHLKRVEETPIGSQQQMLERLNNARMNAETTKRNKIMLRYRLPNWKQWNCQLPDDAPEGYIRYFSLVGEGTLSLGSAEQCQIFLYQGRTFHTSNNDTLSTYVILYEPSSSSGYNNGKGNLVDEQICIIDNWK